MLPDASLDSGFIAHAIQLAIAPVFLLTGIAALIGVMANRLARVIDRARHLQATWPDMTEQSKANARGEVADLERRRHLASRSINFCTAAALLVCIVIMALFAEEFYSGRVKWVAGGLFVLAMFCLIGGLFTFLREVWLASHSIRIDIATVSGEPD